MTSRVPDTQATVRPLRLAGPAEARRRAWRLVALLLGAGAAVRALRFAAPFATPYHWDEAATGAWALQVLQGTLPANFLGNEYQGIPAVYPLAAWFALAGSSPAVFDVFAYLAGLVGLWTGWLLARRLLEGPAALGALLALAVPPLPLAARSLSGGLGYPALLVLGNVFLLGCHSLFFRPSAPRRTLLGLGLVAGLGWWASPLFVVYLAPFLGLALRTGLAWRRASAWFAGGALLGSLPSWIYEVVYFPSTRFIVHAGGAAPAEPFARRALVILETHLPAVLGAPPRSGQALASLVVAVTVALVLLGAVLSLWRDRREIGWMLGLGGAPVQGRIVLWGVAIANLALVLASPQGAIGDRYLFPLYSVVPLWIGIALAALISRQRLVGVMAAATLALLHGWINWRAGPGGVPATHWRWAPVVRPLEPLITWLDARGIRQAYWAARGFPPSYELSYLAQGRVVFADLWREFVLPHARLVDAAIAPPLVATAEGDEAEELRGTLAGLGLRTRETQVGRYVVLEPDAAVRSGFAPLSPKGWRVTATPNPALAANLIDRDVSTGWTSGREQQPGQAIVVDLGREHVVARLDLLAVDWQNVPTGFRLDVSADGAGWEPVVSVPRYWGPLFFSEHHPVLKVRRGRVQAVFPPRAARWLRVVQTGPPSVHAWAAREVFVYGPAPPPAREEPPLDALFGARPPRFVYTSAWLAARLRADSGRRIGTPEFNYFVNSNGRPTPDPRWLEPFRLEPGRALLLGRDADVPGVEEALAALEVTVETRSAGPYRLLTATVPPPSPRILDRRGWRVTASSAPDDAWRAADGDARTRWTAHAPDGDGPQLTLDLGRAVHVSSIRITPGLRGAGPRGLALEGSLDGATWIPLGPARWTGALYWTGAELLRNGAEGWQVGFPRTRVRHLRVRLGPEWPGGRWSVSEIACFE